MNKQISVGNCVVALNRSLHIFNPFGYFKRVNDRGKDDKISNDLEIAHYNLCRDVLILFKHILLYRKEYVSHKCDQILKQIEHMKGLVDSLQEDRFQIVKDTFNDWSFIWMINYIKDSEILSEKQFAESNHLPIHKKAANLRKRLIEDHFTESEIMVLVEEGYLDDSYLEHY